MDGVWCVCVWARLTLRRKAGRDEQEPEGGDHAGWLGRRLSQFFRLRQGWWWMVIFYSWVVVLRYYRMEKKDTTTRLFFGSTLFYVIVVVERNVPRLAAARTEVIIRIRGWIWTSRFRLPSLPSCVHSRSFSRRDCSGSTRRSSNMYTFIKQRIHFIHILHTHTRVYCYMSTPPVGFFLLYLIEVNTVRNIYTYSLHGYYC